MARIIKRLAYLLFVLLTSPFVLAEEKIINFYNWADYIAPDTLANFEKEFGIKVNYDIYDTTDIADAKLLAGNTGYDLVLHSAAYSARLIAAGIYLPLDFSKLPNWRHIDEGLIQELAEYDPGNRFIAPYMWGTTGISFNVDMLRKRIPEVSLETADFFFKPEILSRIADCGVTMLDGAIDTLPSVMNFLGYHANSIDPQHLEEAEQVMKSIRPYIRYFSSAKALIDLPNREICAAMTWSGDYSIAKRRAEEANIDINLGYAMLTKGIHSWFDALVIPADAPHPDNAHLLLNYLMRPQVIAQITNFTGYANGNRTATRYVDKTIRDDPGIYPDENVRRKLQPVLVYSPKKERPRSRVWTRIKTGI